MFELNDVLQSGYYEFPLRFDKENWFANAVIKLEHKNIFFFTNIMKDNKMSQEGEEVFKNNSTCPFCGKSINSKEFRDPCHLTGKFSGPAQHKCSNKIGQKQLFFPFVFHNFSNYYCHLFFKKLIHMKKHKVPLHVIP